MTSVCQKIRIFRGFWIVSDIFSNPDRISFQKIIRPLRILQCVDLTDLKVRRHLWTTLKNHLKKNFQFLLQIATLVVFVTATKTLQPQFTSLRCTSVPISFFILILYAYNILHLLDFPQIFTIPSTNNFFFSFLILNFCIPVQVHHCKCK